MRLKGGPILKLIVVSNHILPILLFIDDEINLNIFVPFRYHNTILEISISFSDLQNISRHLFKILTQWIRQLKVVWVLP